MGVAFCGACNDEIKLLMSEYSILNNAYTTSNVPSDIITDIAGKAWMDLYEATPDPIYKPTYKPTIQSSDIKSSSLHEFSQSLQHKAKAIFEYTKGVAYNAAESAKLIFRDQSSSIAPALVPHRQMKGIPSPFVHAKLKETDLIKRMNAIKTWQESKPWTLYYSFPTLHKYIPLLLKLIQPFLPFNIFCEKAPAFAFQSKLQQDIQTYENKWREINKITTPKDESFFKAIQDLQSHLLIFFTRLANLKVLEIFSGTGMSIGRQVLLNEKEYAARERIHEKEITARNAIRELEQAEKQKNTQAPQASSYLSTMWSYVPSASSIPGYSYIPSLSSIPGYSYVPSLSAIPGYSYLPSLSMSSIYSFHIPEFPYYNPFKSFQPSSSDEDFPPASPTSPVKNIDFNYKNIRPGFLGANPNQCSIHTPQYAQRCCANAGHIGIQPSGAAGIPCQCICHTIPDVSR